MVDTIGSSHIYTVDDGIDFFPSITTDTGYLFLHKPSTHNKLKQYYAGIFLNIS